MLHLQILELFKKLDKPEAGIESIKENFEKLECEVNIQVLENESSASTYISVKIPGKNGKVNGGDARTLGIIGRLGGLGARPEMNGFVSDGDGALAALSSAMKLAEMNSYGDSVEGDIIVITHIDTHAPTQPHDPVPFMGSSLDQKSRNKYEVREEMDAILSIDTTKGNRILNHTGIALTPPIKEGYILRVREDMLDIQQNVTGSLPVIFPITTQDITPYGNNVFHINSILQPSIATKAPVVGVAITSETAIPGSGTGSSHLNSVEEAARYCVEVAKVFGSGKLNFYDVDEYNVLLERYGNMSHLQE